MNRIELQYYPWEETQFLQKYFQDPFQFWDALPWGEFPPQGEYTALLPTQIGTANLPQKLKTTIETAHENNTLYTYWTQIPHTNLISLVSSWEPLSPSQFEDNPQVEDKTENSALIPIHDHYFYNQQTERLSSFNHLSARNASTRVALKYFKSGRSTGASHLSRVGQTTWGNRGRFDIRTPYPRNASQLLSEFHELGHVIWEETVSKYFVSSLHHYADYDTEIGAFYERYDEINMQPKHPDEKLIEINHLIYELKQTAAYRRMMGEEMVKEYLVWIEAIRLMDEAGLSDVVTHYQPQIREDVFFSVKTRMNLIS